QTLVLPDTSATGRLMARERGVLAGGAVFAAAMAAAPPGARTQLRMSDGAQFEPSSEIARVQGPARAVLRAERVALNLIQRMCAIATLTAAYVAAVEGTGVRIVDTRKTTPGLRALERYAVRCG